MIVGIRDGIVVTILDGAFKSVDDTVGRLPDGIVAEDAPDNVMPGWTFEDGKFSAPRQPNFEYDYLDNRYYSHEEYRKVLHSRTTDDTMQAYRKLRQGDKTIDWQAWLDALDAYNVAIEETKNQETYPESVVYPEYPTRPTPQS